MSRFAAVALLVAGLFVPSAASAASRHHGRSHKAAPSYPMKADEFRALMEKRIDHVRAAIDKKLDRRGVSSERKKAIHKIFDDASKDLRLEIARAAADGTVTESEADKVKSLAAGLRGKVRERLRAEKNPALKEKLAKEEAAKKAKSERAEKQAKEEAKQAKSERAEKQAKEDASKKVAHADAPKAKSGTTKATKAKASSAKKAGPTKTAKAQPTKRERPKADEVGENL